MTNHHRPTIAAIHRFLSIRIKYYIQVLLICFAGYRPLQTIQPDPIPVFVGPPMVPGGYMYPHPADVAARRLASGRNGNRERRARSKSGRRHRDSSNDRVSGDELKRVA